MREKTEFENRKKADHSCIKSITGIYGTMSINLCEMMGCCKHKDKDEIR